MGRIIISENLTFDGVVQDPAGETVADNLALLTCQRDRKDAQ